MLPTSELKLEQVRLKKGEKKRREYKGTEKPRRTVRALFGAKSKQKRGAKPAFQRNSKNAGRRKKKC